MAAPVKLLPGQWTQIAPAGFGTMVIQCRNSDFWVELSAVAPVTSTGGILINKDDELQQIGTNQAAYAAWGRPSSDDPHCYANIIY
jgi:hypothetical protein